MPSWANMGATHFSNFRVGRSGSFKGGATFEQAGMTASSSDEMDAVDNSNFCIFGSRSFSGGEMDERPF